MISNNVSPLEMKSLESTKPSKKAKGDDDAFKKEMLENEKRMKKKSIDGREGAANANSSHQSKQTNKKETTSSEGSKSSKKMTAHAEGIQNNKKSEQVESATDVNLENSQQIKNGDVSAKLSAEMMADFEAQNQTPTAGMDMSALQNIQNKDGKLSLEGMMAVQPQTLQPVSTVVNSEGSVDAGATADSLLAAVPVSKDQKSSDLLSQDFNQDFSGFNTGSELSQLQNSLVKENSQNQQVFAGVLEAKIQQTSEQVKDSNVENIISQAKAILKDGGGEMKVKMTPEGLGTIDLKVGVQNGQVSVEILAQDQNVKKMFEDSVFDIRNALESQNLKIDTFRVGVSEHFDQPPGQQNPAQQFAEREFARDFMGQFRDERQGFRNQGIDTILNNRSGFGNKPEGLAPAAATKNMNGRLNIIA